jgi:hypothetical protein
LAEDRVGVEGIERGRFSEGCVGLRRVRLGERNAKPSPFGCVLGSEFDGGPKALGRAVVGKGVGAPDGKFADRGHGEDCGCGSEDHDPDASGQSELCLRSGTNLRPSSDGGMKIFSKNKQPNR